MDAFVVVMIGLILFYVAQFLDGHARRQEQLEKREAENASINW